MDASNLVYRPLILGNWDDFETLFGKNGACDGCWCMWWRQTRSEYSKNRGEKNKQKIYALVNNGTIPGLIFYHENLPIGWCSIGDRKEYASLNRSKILKSIDNQPVWSIVCFFIHKNYRKMGYMKEILKGAIEYAKNEGVKILEGYPKVPRQGVKPMELFMGLPSLYEAFGFQEVIRRSPGRPIYRLELN